MIGYMKNNSRISKPTGLALTTNLETQEISVSSANWGKIGVGSGQNSSTASETEFNQSLYKEANGAGEVPESKSNPSVEDKEFNSEEDQLSEGTK